MISDKIFLAHTTWGPFRPCCEPLKCMTWHWRRRLRLSKSCFHRNRPYSIPTTTFTWSCHPRSLLQKPPMMLLTCLSTQKWESRTIPCPPGFVPLWPIGKPLTLCPVPAACSYLVQRLANSGSDWVQEFARYNSGTYNNQWVVLDRKLFVSQQPLTANLLWIIEQMPGLTMTEDVSHYLS